MKNLTLINSIVDKIHMHGNDKLYMIVFNVLTDNNRNKIFSTNNKSIMFNMNIVNRDILIMLNNMIDKYILKINENEILEINRTVIMDNFSKSVNDTKIDQLDEISNYIGLGLEKYSTVLNDDNESLYAKSENSTNSCNNSISSINSNNSGCEYSDRDLFGDDSDNDF